MADDNILGKSFDFTVIDTISYGMYDTTWSASSTSISGPIQVFLPKWVSQYVCPGTKIVAMNFAYSTTLDGLAIMERNDMETMWFTTNPEPSHCFAELCAGLGGWSQGAEAVGGNITTYIDINPVVAKTLARSLHVPLLTLPEAIEAAKARTLPSVFLLQACIKEPWVWSILGFRNIKHVLASPPCPPWSTATDAKGLECIDGHLIIDIVANASFIGIETISFENVAGIAEHCHYTKIRKSIRDMGWKIILAGVHPAEPMCPMHRSRWLAAIVPQTMQLFDHKIKHANDMKMPFPAPGIGRINSMLAADCVQECFQHWELQELCPTPDAIQAMSRFDLLPPKQRTVKNRSKTDKEIFMLRVKTMKMCLPTIMAMQGAQHQLPEHQLKRKGLFAFVVPYMNRFRYVAPFEVLCAMAFSKATMLPRQFSDAWRAVGNALTIPQAAFHCYRLHSALGKLSPFHPQAESLSDVMCEINRSRYKLQEYQVQVSHDGMYMYLDPIHHIPATPKRPFNDSGSLQEDYNVKKISAGYQHETTVEPKGPLDDGTCPISPTLPFHVCEDEVLTPTEIDENSPTGFPSTELAPMELSWEDILHHGAATDSFISTHKIQYGGMNEDSLYALPPDISKAWEKGFIQEHFGTIPFHMFHEQLTWSFIGWVKPDAILSQVIQSFLPHASQELFKTLKVNDVEVSFDFRIPQCAEVKCVFNPTIVHRLICTKILKQPITLRIDLTWKISDVVAFLAAEAAILPSAVSIWTADKECPSNAFAIDIPTTIFHARLTAVTHVLTKDALADTHHVHDLPNDEAMKHPKPGTIAIAFAEPQWKKVRVICMNEKETVATMKQKMFPGCIKPLFYHDGSPIPASETIGELIKRHGDIDILFDYRQPMPCTTLAFAKPFQFPDECCDYKIEVQDPFSVHTTGIYVLQAASITEVAARVVASYSVDISLQITQNGRLIDPRVTVNQCSEQIFRFRATGLAGGAKANDDVTRALEAALTARGVPADVVQSRITLIMNKIPPKDIRPDIHLDTDAFWTRLKFMANEAKVRLITSQELKEHQKKSRAEKKHSNAITPAP